VSPHPLASPAFWRGFAITLRPYPMFVSGAAGPVGLALGAACGTLAAAAFAALFASYGFGQALTDVFQTDTDALSAPERPLVRGEVGRGAVLAASLVGLPACALVLAVANPWTLVPSTLAVALLATCTPLKRRWWGGPPWNSAAVALLPPPCVRRPGAAPTEPASLGSRPRHPEHRQGIPRTPGPGGPR